MAWVAIIATAFGLLCVWLALRRNIWCWPAGLQRRSTDNQADFSSEFTWFSRAAELPLWVAAGQPSTPARITGSGMTAGDMGRMVKRRMWDARLPSRICPHSFRVATITNLLEQNVPLEDVQHLAGLADPRTTRLYDRRHKRVTRNIVERISI